MEHLQYYNVQISTEEGIRYFDVDIFLRRYPRLGALMLSNYNKGVLAFDVRGTIAVRLV